MAEREIKARRGRGPRLLADRRRQEGASSYFRFRDYRIDATFPGVTDQPTYEDAREVAAAVPRALRDGRARLGRPRLHPLHQRRAPRRPSSGGSCPLEVDADEADAPTGPPADLEYEPSPTGILDELLPRYVESPHLLGPARRVGLRARRPPAGHEGGHRQRRGAQDQAHPHHEPGPPGRHHHRDHGDRRRRRGPQGATRAAPRTCSSSTSSRARLRPAPRLAPTTPARGTDRAARTARRTSPAPGEPQMTVTENPTTPTARRAEGRPRRRHRRPGGRRRVPPRLAARDQHRRRDGPSASTAATSLVTGEVAQQIGDSRVPRRLP